MYSPRKEPHGVGVMIAGGACPATSLVGHELIQSHLRAGNDVSILRDGLNSILENKEPEPIHKHKESYVDDLLGEASRDYVGDENALRCAQRLQELQRDYGLQTLHVVGGDGTAAGLHHMLSRYEGTKKPSVSLAPKTIDGDVLHTDTTIGHATAIHRVDEMMQACRHDSLKMKRALFVQVPGRDAGHLALRGGEGHADIILIKEAPFTIEHIIEEVRRRYYEQGYCVVSVAEGFVPKGVDESETKSADKNGNNGSSIVAKYLAGKTKYEMLRLDEKLKKDDDQGKKPINYTSIPSEILRGANPVQEDRELAADIGAAMFEHDQTHLSPYELAFVVNDNDINHIPLEEIAKGHKPVPEDDYHPKGMYLNHHKQALT